ncbi:hypothetical protein LWI29_032184 [Acer saccharum]|uniref:F-box protein n=1 Tax=Acer saccharum TaxID=4024 RepID=A0AA39SBE7_ACESA|nr:hypothetical protein LWI29_032184 [Acer saccharum]
MEESDDIHAALALMYGYAARYAPSAVIEARIDALVFSSNYVPKSCLSAALFRSIDEAVKSPLGVITVFDLAEEKFKTLPLPISNPPNPPESWQCIVHDIGEYLCVTFEVYGSRTTEFVEAVKGIWIMKKYGVKESWTRIVKSHDLYNPIPLCLWEDDGIILYSHIGKPKRVLCYDEKDGKVRKECVFDGNYRMYAYIESLVSPKYNFEYSTTRGFPHYIAQSQLQSTGQDPSSSSVILDISGLLTEDQLV